MWVSQTGWFKLENPTKMDDWGYPHDQTDDLQMWISLAGHIAWW